MRLKSFYGPNMTEIMRAVRESLGDNAIIVATRDDEMGGLRVTVAIEEAQQQAGPAAVLPKEDASSETMEMIAKALLQHRTQEALAERLLATATQLASEDPLLALGAAIDTHFKFESLSDDVPSQPLILIGPPGAGKTLCAAKLATKAALAQKPVALISTDTERAGGMAQLAAFARVLEKEILEIEDAPALEDAVSMQKSGTLILIDTAGCNPFKPSDKQNLAALIKASGARPVLVLPADMDSLEATDSAKIFAELGAKSILFTRLDMTRRVGGLLQTAFETRLPLCAFSSSQSAAEAPAPLNPVSLARLVLPKVEAKTESKRSSSL